MRSAHIANAMIVLLALAGTARGQEAAKSSQINGVITYTYYAGTMPIGKPLPGPPVDAGTYTVVATFKSADGNYTGGSSSTTFTIQKATPQVSVRNNGGTYNGAAFPTAGIALASGVSDSGPPLDVDSRGVPLPLETGLGRRSAVQNVTPVDSISASYYSQQPASPSPVQFAPPDTGQYLSSDPPLQYVQNFVVPRFWANAEYLMWWIRTGPLPVPLVTTSSDPGTNVSGAIGQPATTILYGGTNVDYGFFNGLRISGGAWIDDSAFVGVEGEMFFLQAHDANFNAASNGNGFPPLYLPAFNTQLQAERALIVADPISGLAGNVSIVSHSELWGALAAGVVNVINTGSTSVDLLGGFRYLDLDERFELRNTTTNLPIGYVDTLFDRFEATSQFYGGLVGIRVGCTSGPWFLSLTERIAIGANRDVVNISGSVTETGTGAPTPGTFPGGFFAQPTNIGRTRENRFSVVPEVQVKIGYQFRRNVTGFLAYDFIYWTDVVRPGDQIDRDLNLSQSPVFGTTGGVLVGAPTPRPLNNPTDFWTQGLSFGLALTF